MGRFAGIECGARFATFTRRVAGPSPRADPAQPTRDGNWGAQAASRRPEAAATTVSTGGSKPALPWGQRTVSWKRVHNRCGISGWKATWRTLSACCAGILAGIPPAGGRAGAPTRHVARNGDTARKNACATSQPSQISAHAFRHPPGRSKTLVRDSLLTAPTPTVAVAHENRPDTEAEPAVGVVIIAQAEMIRVAPVGV